MPLDATARTPVVVPVLALVAAAPPAVVVGFVRPVGLLAVVALGLVAAAAVRVWSGVVGAEHADAHAVRAGLLTIAAGLALAAMLLLLGPATVVVLPLLDVGILAWWWFARPA